MPLEAHTVSERYNLSLSQETTGSFLLAYMQDSLTALVRILHLAPTSFADR
jgi:hypothetical protein